MRKKIYHFFAIVVLSLLISPSFIYGKHIVGGDVTYECLGNNGITVNYLITFTMYRDSYGGGADFDGNARFGIFRGNGNSWMHITSLFDNPEDVGPISIETGNPCLEVPSGLGVEKGVYRFEVSLNVSDVDSYMIVYQRCCRNNTIFNIVDPEDTGAAFSVTISPFAQAECDNSPTFNDFPPVVICANSLLEFDHSATDEDGDQIVYKFCAPKAAGGTQGVNFGDPNACDGITPDPEFCGPPFNDVIFKVPQYRFDRPLGGNPIVEINQSTGLISGIPNIQGQFVVGVCAETYRNGELIGSISRDFQFNVTICEVAVQASMQADEVIDGDHFIINSCGDNTVDFVNLSSDQSKIFSYDWELDVNGVIEKFDIRNITYTFPDTGQYEGYLYLNKEGNFVDCKDSAQVTINIYPEIVADFAFDYDTCEAGPVTFTDLSFTGAGDILDWDWNFESDGFSDIQNPIYRYETPGVKSIKLVVEDKNQCRDSITRDVTWYPVPPLIIVQPNQFVGCAPEKINFNNLSSPIDETYDVIWDFGDGNIVNEISPMNVYEEPGVYSVNVDITSPIGCNISQSYDDWIRILESPEAGFSFTPESPSIFDREVDFIDESSGATAWLYDIGGVAKLEQNPTYYFPDTGVVSVVQVVTHPSGCTDTLQVLIDIEPLITLHLPNAFTPNNDGLNDVFKGKGIYDGLQSYTMLIFNRWGEQVFESTDPDFGWNGNVNNGGSLCPGGVYVFNLSYIGPRGDRVNEKGHITLIR